MPKPEFSLVKAKDVRIVKLVNRTDKKILARWAIDCAERVMPYFEKEYPKDKRPRIALDVLREWMKTGEFKMAVIRKASLDSHAAAKEIGNDNPASSAAHVAGQAVATAHVYTHSMGPAMYAQQAIYRATGSMEKVAKERDWQYKRLRELRK